MHIRPILRADLPAAASVKAESFFDDTLSDFLSPGRADYPQDFYQDMLATMRLRIVQSGSWGYVCVSDRDDPLPAGLPPDPPGLWKEEILGLAWWSRSGPKSSRSPYLQNNTGVGASIERTLVGIEAWYNSLLGVNRASSPKNYRTFIAGVREQNVYRPLQDHDHWILQTLGVSPRHQRRGVGAMLLEWGIKRAREEGVPVTCIASPMGYGLYTKHGFRLVNVATLPEVPDIRPGPVLVLDEKGKLIRKLTDDDGVLEKHGMRLTGVWNEKSRQGLSKKELEHLPYVNDRA